jgi:hypothetical protein
MTAVLRSVVTPGRADAPLPVNLDNTDDRWWRPAPGPGTRRLQPTMVKCRVIVCDRALEVVAALMTTA